MPPDLFGNIQCWMYTGELSGSDYKILLPTQLCCLWISAAFLQMPRLQNFVMRKLFGNKSTNIIAVPKIYEMTKGYPKSTLRQLYLDHCAFEWPRKEWYPVALALHLESERVLEQVKLPRTFLLDLMNDVCTVWEDNARLLGVAIAKGNMFDKKDPKKLKLEDYLVEESKLYRALEG